MKGFFLFVFLNSERTMSIRFRAASREEAFDLLRGVVKYPYSWVLYSQTTSDGLDYVSW